MSNAQDPLASDRTPRVTIQINGKDYTNVEDYSYDSDVLKLGDPFAVTLSNVDGGFAGTINLGDSVKFYMADPEVNSGARTLKLTGIVTDIESRTDNGTGSVIVVRGADLGWHLSHNDGALINNGARWPRLRGLTFQQFLNLVLDSSWGFQGVRAGNNLNATLKQGRPPGAALQGLSAGYTQPLPPIQFEPGETIADKLVTYARRAKMLVNVSADGWIQLFQPNNGQTAYTLHLHRSNEAERRYNNVLSASVSQSIEGVYTRVDCVWQALNPSPVNGAYSPNLGRHIRTYESPSSLPFVHRVSFSDSEQLNNDNADKRALWKWQRGQFDSWSASYTVFGHSQDGVFFEPDTMVEIHDSVNGVDGNYYISAVRYSRTLRAGTTTTLTVRKPGLLGA